MGFQWGTTSPQLKQTNQQYYTSQTNQSNNISQLKQTNPTSFTTAASLGEDFSTRFVSWTSWQKYWPVLCLVKMVTGDGSLSFRNTWYYRKRMWFKIYKYFLNRIVDMKVEPRLRIRPPFLAAPAAAPPITKIYIFFFKEIKNLRWIGNI